MKIRIICLLSSLIVFAAALSGSARWNFQLNTSTEARPVLVELFTSEGCFSCPPADLLLTALEQKQPVKGVQIIVLSEHVDYWNHDGWEDPFSSSDLTQRQSEYAKVFKDKDGVYTPQMIVDGQIQFVGNDGRRAFDAIARSAQAQKLDVKIAIARSSPKNITFDVSIQNDVPVTNGDAAEVMIALAESNLTSSVSAGENSGRKLTHSAVVRKLASVGAFKSGDSRFEKTFDLNERWKTQNMKVVAFVQEHKSRRVIGVASLGLGAR